MTQQKPTTSANPRTFFGHPRELATLFGMEVWERLSYYGMQGILLIYLYYASTQGGLGINQGTAVGLMAAYGSGMYLSTIVGAWCADRLFGNERTLFYAGIIVMLGHILLALVPGVIGVTLGLVLIAFGSGGVKATCAAMAGALYNDDNERRDAGFSIFYMGVNLGALVGPLLTGLLQENLGFHYGFGLAAIGMAIGLAQYTRGRKRLPASEKRPPSPLSPRERTNYGTGAVAFVVLVAVLVGSGWINTTNLDYVFFGVIVVAAVAYFIGILSSSHITTDERKQTLIFIPLFLSSTVFWSLYLQLNTVFTVLFDQRVNRQLGGFQIPVSWLSAFEALMVICLASVLAWLWVKLGKRQPSSTLKFVISLFIMAICMEGYVPFVGNHGHTIIPLVATLVLTTIFVCSELCLSPIGLSITSKLAPSAFKTQMLALFYLSIALGMALGGTLSGYFSAANEVAWFQGMAAYSVAGGLFLLCFLPLIKRVAPGDY